MTPDNMPVLYINVMDGLPSDLSRDAFLWATDRPDCDRMCYRAERFAREVATLEDKLMPMFDIAARTHGRDGVDPGLWDFILTRHANWKWGGNLRPDYAQDATP